jgi:hypothetical protein
LNPFFGLKVIPDYILFEVTDIIIGFIENVATSNLETDTIYQGNPAKAIRKRIIGD